MRHGFATTALARRPAQVIAPRRSPGVLRRAELERDPLALAGLGQVSHQTRIADIERSRHGDRRTRARRVIVV
jgi:hypothetical protein